MPSLGLVARSLEQRGGRGQAGGNAREIPLCQHGEVDDLHRVSRQDGLVRSDCVLQANGCRPQTRFQHRAVRLDASDHHFPRSHGTAHERLDIDIVGNHDKVAGAPRRNPGRPARRAVCAVWHRFGIGLIAKHRVNTVATGMPFFQHCSPVCMARRDDMPAATQQAPQFRAAVSGHCKRGRAHQGQQAKARSAFHRLLRCGYRYSADSEDNAMRQYRQPRAMDRQPNLAGPQVFGTRRALSGLMAVYRERG